MYLAALGLPCCAQACSSCGNQGYSLIAVLCLLFVMASLGSEHSSRVLRLSLRHVESSQIRDRTHFPCIGRTPNHWTTTELPP